MRFRLYALHWGATHLFALMALVIYADPPAAVTAGAPPSGRQGVGAAAAAGTVSPSRVSYALLVARGRARHHAPGPTRPASVGQWRKWWMTSPAIATSANATPMATKM